jgi:putative transposase
LPGYDYTSPRAYFITICVRGGECLLGEVGNAEMRLNELGQIPHGFWAQVPVHFPNVSVDAFVIKGEGTSPLQDIQNGDAACRGAVTAPTQDVQNGDAVCRGAVAAPTAVATPTLGQIVAYYKYQTTKRINELRDMPDVPFWQGNYWEHIIRNEQSLNRIREYIENNPAHWEEDQLHPDAVPNAFNQWKT